MCVLTLALGINLVCAVESIWTTSDSASQVHTEQFGVGQTVYIW